MEITLRGATGLPGVDGEVAAALAWLGPRLPNVGLPVRVTLVKARGRSTSGSAYWPVTAPGKRHMLHRGHKLGLYEVTLRVSGFTLSRPYPASWTYRKAAGPVECLDCWDAIAHTLFHELRHVQQYDECRKAWPKGPPVRDGREYGSHATFAMYERNYYQSGSCEVDAEVVARDWLAAWRQRGVTESATQGPP